MYRTHAILKRSPADCPLGDPHCDCPAGRCKRLPPRQRRPKDTRPFPRLLIAVIVTALAIVGCEKSVDVGPYRARVSIEDTREEEPQPKPARRVDPLRRFNQ